MLPIAKFPLGRVVATPASLEVAQQHGVNLLTLVARHAAGDWGHVSPDDWKENDLSLERGFRILSAYPIDPQKDCRGFGSNTIWIITEADRSVTTILLPDEY